MFEKSLYDLIRGLRSHKGNEAEYIRGIIRECRTEIRSQDMDLKATGLLKLIYLEMFGHEMSWASFHVLEVMSSSKHLQKRVGYLGAAQTFRSDTEVLMLATNLMKKDLSSVSTPTMSLPLITLPHVATVSLAQSLLTDILPRLTHFKPVVRKKSVVTIYRLALVYPETLRVAWPKMKERLMDKAEESFVTAAVVNVVCELSWRNPREFLPLAPRLFELLIEDGNNWMLIKIIKLFATLTPLEPRLVRKLVRPLKSLIQNTEAMSLLYECINGIIQGGILDTTEDVGDMEALAGLCLDKLRGMIIVENDPNLKYVALLAFNRIVGSHPALVSAQQDVIMGCLDDPDISIRLQALELVTGMVSPDNIQIIVNSLMKQLRSSPISTKERGDEGAPSTPIEPKADSEGEDPGERLVEEQRVDDMPPIPNEYRREAISGLLDMCSQDTYSKIPDFEWYLDLLVELVRLLPPPVLSDQGTAITLAGHTPVSLAERVGSQIRDIAVRIKALRLEACRAAESLILLSSRTRLFPAVGLGADPILESVAWIVGEFSDYLVNPWETLNSLIHQSSALLSPPILCTYLQAIPKVFLRVTIQSDHAWNESRKTTISLLLARVIDFQDGLSSHPNLDVQERAVEFLELFRLVSEAISSTPSEDGLPLIIRSALPDLFSGSDLNPVAPGAQKKVSVPSDLDLATLINPNLPSLLQLTKDGVEGESDDEMFRTFYHEREPEPVAAMMPRPKEVERVMSERMSYQEPENPQLIAKQRAERYERNRDDPFYIAPEADRNGPQNYDREDLDLEAIPIVDLLLEDNSTGDPERVTKTSRQKPSRASRRIEIAADETFNSDATSSDINSAPRSLETGNAFPPPGKSSRPRKNLLQVDSSGLERFSLTDSPNGKGFDLGQREAEDLEMAAALKEIERTRLEMQRAAERVETAQGVDVEGTVVKRKKKKTMRREQGPLDGVETGSNAEQQPAEQEGSAIVKKVKKKKKKKKKEEEEKKGTKMDEKQPAEGTIEANDS